ncbi:MAG: hypothetical protein R3A46_04760 [Thermomicrobiales bacterium]
MALRPPRQRRGKANPFTRRLPDEAIGLIAGFLIASMVIRVILLAAGLEQWTITWQVVDALTLWIIWPLDQLNFGTDPTLIGRLTPLDVLVAALLTVLALFLLATRTFTRRL